MMYRRPLRLAINLATGLATLASAATAWAHPGHGTTDAGQVEHYVAEPIHAAPLAATLAALAVLAAVGVTAYRLHRGSSRAAR